MSARALLARKTGKSQFLKNPATSQSSTYLHWHVDNLLLMLLDFYHKATSHQNAEVLKVLSSNLAISESNGVSSLTYLNANLVSTMSSNFFILTPC